MLNRCHLVLKEREEQEHKKLQSTLNLSFPFCVLVPKTPKMAKFSKGRSLIVIVFYGDRKELVYRKNDSGFKKQRK